eukprot:SAG11_NODE_2237_length_3650_cov_49.920867_5_plen_68_part_01
MVVTGVSKFIIYILSGSTKFSRPTVTSISTPESSSNLGGSNAPTPNHPKNHPKNSENISKSEGRIERV